MRIAVVGSGISGLVAAHFASKEHEVTVFEKASRIGGHTATVDVSLDGRDYVIDTGFIVFNDRTYPNFIQLIESLKVPYKESSMGFSVSNRKTGQEYAGNNVGTLFAQKRNWLAPSFLWMLKEIVRFNRVATEDAVKESVGPNVSLGEYLEKHGFSGRFCNDYLVPMGAAIWSASYAQVMAFPAVFFINFFHNHGLLTVTNKPQWYVIEGGSRSYLAPLTATFKDSIELNADIAKVVRNEDAVVIEMQDGSLREFDHAIFACHSDQALALIGDANKQEQDILGAIGYQENSVVLHRDESLLPKMRKVWSSWNYLRNGDDSGLPRLTYNMNILQGIESDHTFCVSLNADELIDSEKIIDRFSYAHPQFSVSAYYAQRRKEEICGKNRTSFCGAYWANGFHEDGVVSALDALSRLGVDTAL